MVVSVIIQSQVYFVLHGSLLSIKSCLKQSPVHVHETYALDTCTGDWFNPFTAIMTSDDVLRKVHGSYMSAARRVTSGFNSHVSCTARWSKVFETNTAGQQIFSERPILGAIFTNGTNALAEKGLTMPLLKVKVHAIQNTLVIA